MLHCIRFKAASVSVYHQVAGFYVAGGENWTWIICVKTLLKICFCAKEIE